MFLGLYLLGEEDAFDDAFFVDDEGGAEGAHILATIHALLAPCTILPFWSMTSKSGILSPIFNITFQIFAKLIKIRSGYHCNLIKREECGARAVSVFC